MVIRVAADLAKGPGDLPLNQTHPAWAFLIVFFIAWHQASTHLHAGVLFLAADANVNNPVNGSAGAPLNAGNSMLFLNILGSSSRVLIQNEYSPPETGDGTTAVNTLFNSISGVVSTTDYPGATITNSLLSNIDILIIRPRLAFTATEIDALRDFVHGPGKLFLIGENASLNIAQDTVNELLQGIGSSMSLQNAALGSGYQTTTSIASNPYTAGVTSITYNYTNSIGGGTPLVSSVEPGSPVIIAFENFSSVPEPTSLGLFFLGMSMFLIRSRNDYSK